MLEKECVCVIDNADNCIGNNDIICCTHAVHIKVHYLGKNNQMCSNNL